MLKILREVPDLDVATQIAAKGFARAISPALREDVEGHLRSGELVYRVMDGDDDIGFGVFKVLDSNVLYVSGIVLNPSRQRKGLFAEVVGQARTDAPDVLHLALRTQSCACWAAARKLCYSSDLDWAPKPARNWVLAAHLVQKAEVVADYLGRKNSVDSWYESHYETPLYGKKPVYHDKKIQAWWDGWCKYHENKALICFGRLKMS